MTFAADFAERLKSLTDKQLDRLERALQRLQTGFAVPLSTQDEELVAARTYELSLEEPEADSELLQARAAEEFRTGELKPLGPFGSRPERSPLATYEAPPEVRPRATPKNASYASSGPRKAASKAEEPPPKLKSDIYTIFGIPVPSGKSTFPFYPKAFDGEGNEL